MSTAFHRDLGLEPDESWVLPDGDAARVGSILTKAYEELAARAADAVMVLGDTYTVPLLCLAARRHCVPVIHLEAGLRSFNATSMEEVNRAVAGATAALHLAPTERAAAFLRASGVSPDRVSVVGNPVLDAVRLLGVTRPATDHRSGVLLTAHRPGNVDDPVRLATLVRIVEGLAALTPPVTFPIHPRTRVALDRHRLMDRLQAVPGVEVLPPVPYPRMLELVACSSLVVTDSGGLQEEASWYGVPVVVLRRSTPRWEGVDDGTSILTGLDEERVVVAATRLLDPAEQARVAATPCPYGDGHSARRIADLLEEPTVADLLRIEEPDFVGRPAPGARRG
jgi:UDP-N-acetylglucosamine 2-epimerase (non-hydrolysing)